MGRKNKKRDKRKVSLRSKLTFAVIMNYLILGAFVMLTVTALFFYSVVRARYSDNVDMAKTIEDTVISQVDLSKLVDAVIEQERTDTEAFKKRVFVNEASDQDGQLLSYKWYTEENPDLAKRADYQYVEDVLYAFNRNNKNLNGTSLMVFDKKTHIASLLCDVEKFGAETPTRTDYVMWRNFADEDLEHIEDERWSLLKNLHRYMRVDPKYVVFIWYEPVAYEDEDVIVFIEADVFYNRLLSSVISFVTMFFLLLLVMVLLMGLLYHRKMTRLIVKPVKAISGAARCYTEDHLAGRDNRTHFSSLVLNSGYEFDELAKTMDEMAHEIGKYEEDLTRITAEKERIAAELDVASRIQANMLPKDFPLFPERKEFELFASMTPAKEVGGDFYDVFMTDEDHLCIVMADVAGKGIPAALFMVNSMQTIRARAASGGTPAEILYDVNNMLFKGNKEKMFVTVWFAILTLSTGEVIETNAGHENPAIKNGDGDFAYLLRKHCFVVGARKDMKYRDDTFTLSPGDSLFIYTDGATEATNSSGERFFGERLLAALNEVKDGKPEEILEHMKARIDAFVDGAPQFDDLTMLAVTYHGRADSTEVPE